MKFRKKPLVIDAVQWNPEKHLGEFLKGKYVNHRIGYDAIGAEYTVTEVGIRTLKGFMRLIPGDWIITGIKGEKYPCKHDIFVATYEVA